MIMAEANLGSDIRLFYEGQKYTSYDSESLLTLFPDWDKIIFDLELSYESMEQFDDLIKLRLSYKYSPKFFNYRSVNHEEIVISEM